MLQLIGKYINNFLLIILLLSTLVIVIILTFIPSLVNNFATIEKIEIQGINYSDPAEINETILEYNKKTLIHFPIAEYKSKIEKLDSTKRE